jgi:hypothetical protein
MGRTTNQALGTRLLALVIANGLITEMWSIERRFPMRKTFFVVALLVFNVMFAGALHADDVYVPGYTQKNGTPVQGHHRSTPDGNTWNNYSTRGNVNPYTGQPGYRSPDSSIGGNPYTPPRNNQYNGSGLNMPGYDQHKRKY